VAVGSDGSIYLVAGAAFNLVAQNSPPMGPRSTGPPRWGLFRARQAWRSIQAAACLWGWAAR
jgi:hypothetical protein